MKSFFRWCHNEEPVAWWLGWAGTMLAVFGMLGAFSSCGRSTYPTPMLPESRIIGLEVFNTHWTWEASPWARIGDHPTGYPVFVMIAQDRSACVITAREWATVFLGQRYPCVTGWRQPR